MKRVILAAIVAIVLAGCTVFEGPQHDHDSHDHPPVHDHTDHVHPPTGGGQTGGSEPVEPTKTRIVGPTGFMFNK